MLYRKTSVLSIYQYMRGCTYTSTELNWETRQLIFCYSKPSLLRLQLIRISDNPDRNTKSAVHI
jgi:hypothetical protein